MSSFENNKKSFEDFLKKGLITKEQAVIQSYNYYQQYGLYQSIFMQRNDIVSKMAELEEKEEEEKNDSEIFIKSNLLKIIDLQNYLNDLEIKNEQIVVSPINGIIESLNTSQGEQVNTGDVLIQVSPSIKKHNIITWVPNYVIPYIKVNDQVIIRYDAFPYEQYGQFVGKIESISNLSATDDEISKYNLKPYKNIDSLSFYKVLIAGTESMIELISRIRH
ncbi:HlyD family efflux transporter periplasmic adaptor subunit [Photorhabdus sp. RM323S]|uniref:HlyD family efflux transporter periplasmic adaptor subunit n=1 Tax=Photorhabdus sp. RM323S TaxID=3342828 RepID=UPI0036DF8F57